MTIFDNVNIFQDTLSKIVNNQFLLEAVEKSNSEQIFINNINNLPSKQLKINTTEANIIVTESGSFDAARKYDNVAVLNFASSINPGGGVTYGSFAQEECLCRCSTLYYNISEKTMMEKFYTPHRNNLDISYNNDDIIYTPNVYIIKTDNYIDLDTPKAVNVITCAAPDLRKKMYNASSNNNIITDEELLKLHEQRGRAILETARYFGNDNIILGAFGCGAFKNNPEIVAQAYKNILPEFKYSFKTIEFAILCNANNKINYTTFKKYIG